MGRNIIVIFIFLAGVTAVLFFYTKQLEQSYCQKFLVEDCPDKCIISSSCVTCLNIGCYSKIYGKDIENI